MDEWIKICVHIQWNVVLSFKKRDPAACDMDEPRGHYTK
jgi:hypothetical protein